MLCNKNEAYSAMNIAINMMIILKFIIVWKNILNSRWIMDPMSSQTSLKNVLSLRYMNSFTDIWFDIHVKTAAALM